MAGDLTRSDELLSKNIENRCGGWRHLNALDRQVLKDQATAHPHSKFSQSPLSFSSISIRLVFHSIHRRHGKAVSSCEQTVRRDQGSPNQLGVDHMLRLLASRRTRSTLRSLWLSELEILGSFDLLVYFC